FGYSFGPDFEERHKLRRGENVEIRLDEDNPDAKNIILRAIHYNKCCQCHLDAEGLASVAIHSDKNDCTAAL
ncbi:hypothetical protein BKA61DRAFT_453774, partial [Leptodontidium sp. MPI-SDFR-AT-0119]